MSHPTNSALDAIATTFGTSPHAIQVATAILDVARRPDGYTIDSFRELAQYLTEQASALEVEQLQAEGRRVFDIADRTKSSRETGSVTDYYFVFEVDEANYRPGERRTYLRAELATAFPHAAPGRQWGDTECRCTGIARVELAAVWRDEAGHVISRFVEAA
jgi:hypothetical protein